MFKYTEDEIKILKKNYSLSIDILLPDQETIQWWRNIVNGINEDHPLIGLLMVVDYKGNILFASKDWNKLDSWLKHNTELEEKED